MEINRKLTEVLNDLIQINNDRIEGYQRAWDEASEKDVDLKAIFGRMMDESRRNISQLAKEVGKLGGEVVSGATVSGKIYRTWMDLKATFTGNTRLALLESCEFGEDAAQKSYQHALSAAETLSIDIRQLIGSQKEALKDSHDTIKRFRDLHKKANSDDLIESNNLRNSAIDLGNENFESTEEGGSSHLKNI